MDRGNIKRMDVELTYVTQCVTRNGSFENDTQTQAPLGANNSA
jgi:hypothetical protein